MAQISRVRAAADFLGGDNMFQRHVFGGGKWLVTLGYSVTYFEQALKPEDMAFMVRPSSSSSSEPTVTDSPTSHRSTRGTRTTRSLSRTARTSASGTTRRAGRRSRPFTSTRRSVPLPSLSSEVRASADSKHSLASCRTSSRPTRPSSPTCRPTRGTSTVRRLSLPEPARRPSLTRPRQQCPTPSACASSSCGTAATRRRPAPPRTGRIRARSSPRWPCWMRASTAVDSVADLRIFRPSRTHPFVSRRPSPPPRTFSLLLFLPLGCRSRCNEHYLSSSEEKAEMLSSPRLASAGTLVAGRPSLLSCPSHGLPAMSAELEI